MANYRPPKRELRGGRLALADASQRLAFGATKVTRDLAIPARSTVRTGGAVVFLKRRRRDGSSYTLPLRVPTEESPVVRSTAPAIATKFKNGRVRRIGAGESFTDA